MRDVVRELVEKAQGLDAEGLVGAVLARFGMRVALASSFGAEDQVITDMLCGVSQRPRIFTLDTGRLHGQTYEVIEATRRRYGVEVEMVTPDARKLGVLTTAYGPNLFYESVEKRRMCCQVRKVEPLRGKLAELDAWICGLRSEQSMTRRGLERIEWDEAHGIVKINPLADWSSEQVWAYIREHKVPYNRLHDEGYPSIGCEPCTRAVRDGEDTRAGRWWWERPEHKECGLHLKPKDIKGKGAK
jgi:phosphoadenosine phosphosulfate reductase